MATPRWPAPCIACREPGGSTPSEHTVIEDIEYIIVGGPQHGLITRGAWKADSTTPPAQPACDGLLCRAAARRHGNVGTRYLLLHPKATGEQFLTMLVA